MIEHHTSHFNDKTVRSLEVAATLKGHAGCVNRLAWEEIRGDLLASVSDDRDLIVWKWKPLDDAPWSMAPALHLPTSHRGNMFGVKFLPFSEGVEGVPQLVTGAADGKVLWHRPRSEADKSRCATSSCYDASSLIAKRARLKKSAQQSALSSNSASVKNSATDSLASLESGEAWESIYMYQHRGPVKSVDVLPDSPFVFFSASEDGTVCQFDTREALKTVPVSSAVLSPSAMPSFSSSCDLPDPRASPVWGDGRALITTAYRPRYGERYSDMRHIFFLSRDRRKHVRGDRSATPRHRMTELKHLSISRANPFQMVVACDDPYLRVFDRRMLPGHSCQASSSNLGGSGGGSSSSGGGGERAVILREDAFQHPSLRASLDNVLLFSPIHMGGLEDEAFCRERHRLRLSHATYAEFDASGRHILGTYHADGIFVFDILQSPLDSKPMKLNSEGSGDGLKLPESYSSSVSGASPSAALFFPDESAEEQHAISAPSPMEAIHTMNAKGCTPPDAAAENPTSNSSCTLKDDFMWPSLKLLPSPTSGEGGEASVSATFLLSGRDDADSLGDLATTSQVASSASSPASSASSPVVSSATPVSPPSMPTDSSACISTAVGLSRRMKYFFSQQQHQKQQQRRGDVNSTRQGAQTKDSPDASPPSLSIKSLRYLSHEPSPLPLSLSANASSPSSLPPLSIRLKDLGNSWYLKGNIVYARVLYSLALEYARACASSSAPLSSMTSDLGISQLLTNRAMSFLKDESCSASGSNMALQDCRAALEHCPGRFKTQFYLCKSLAEAGREEDAEHLTQQWLLHWERVAEEGVQPPPKDLTGIPTEARAFQVKLQAKLARAALDWNLKEVSKRLDDEGPSGLLQHHETAAAAEAAASSPPPLTAASCIHRGPDSRSSDPHHYHPPIFQRSALSSTTASSPTLPQSLCGALRDSTANPISSRYCFHHSQSVFPIHQSLQTDIKEAAFISASASARFQALFHNSQRAAVRDETTPASLGEYGDKEAAIQYTAWAKLTTGREGYIVSGGDEGRCVIYDRASGLPVAILRADAHICNAVRPHPTLSLLATSGIDEVVRLWAQPRGLTRKGIPEVSIPPRTMPFGPSDLREAHRRGRLGETYRALKRVGYRCTNPELLTAELLDTGASIHWGRDEVPSLYNFDEDFELDGGISIHRMALARHRAGSPDLEGGDGLDEDEGTAEEDDEDYDDDDEKDDN